MNLRKYQVADDLKNGTLTEDTRAILRGLDYVATGWIARGFFIGIGLALSALVLAVVGGAAMLIFSAVNSSLH